MKNKLAFCILSVLIIFTFDLIRVMNNYKNIMPEKRFVKTLVVVDETLKNKTRNTRQFVMNAIGKVNDIFFPVGIHLIIGDILVENEDEVGPLWFVNPLEKHISLKEMAKWNVKNDQYDIVVTLTGIDEIFRNNGLFIEEIAGSAIVGRVCHKNENVAFVRIKDVADNLSIITLAHEIAHLLGVIHDGDEDGDTDAPGAISCNSEKGFIMESRSKMEQITKWKSGTAWSKCSKDQLSYFSALEVWNCLDRKSPLTVKYPTQDFSVDMMKFEELFRLVELRHFRYAMFIGMGITLVSIYIGTHGGV